MTQMTRPAPAQTDPAGLARTYLDLMEARELGAASRLLGDGFVMNFPGAPGMRTLDELMVRSAGRYRFVKKTYDAFETLHGDHGAIVYVRGSLYGEWPDGTPFSGVRFVDRFEVSGDKIVRQDVWNDLAEADRAGTADAVAPTQA